MCGMGWLRLVSSLKSCLFCRISSLLWGSFAKETYNCEEPTNRRYPMWRIHVWYDAFIWQSSRVCMRIMRATCSVHVSHSILSCTHVWTYDMILHTCVWVFVCGCVCVFLCTCMGGWVWTCRILSCAYICTHTIGTHYCLVRICAHMIWQNVLGIFVHVIW